MGESKEINQKWKRPKNFNIYFFPYSLAAITKVLFLEGRCALDSASNQLRDFSNTFYFRKILSLCRSTTREVTGADSLLY